MRSYNGLNYMTASLNTQSLVDKYEVREYVKEHMGAEYLVPILGVWDDVEEIDFNKLPEKFVLKATHDSGSAIICEDKSALDLEKTKKGLRSH